ncbi:MAG: hypothetical protein FK732_00445 [Asgard group archaeon]|nr:hypothetical protein [Asgard group archaeon]
MRRKKFLAISLFIFVFVLMPVTIANAVQPPLPPEMTILVSDARYTPETALVLDQLAEDAALCGIKLNFEIMGFYDIVMRMYSNDFDLVMFITLATLQPDSFDSIFFLLDFYFGDYNIWNYHNDILKAKIQEMKDFYYNGFEVEAIEVFHEIELIIYEDQPSIAICYHLDALLFYTHQIIVNNHPDRPGSNIAIRKALSFLIDREFYTSTFQTFYTYTVYQTSHLFAWTQYHDDTLPEIAHSIGKAASTLAKAGFRPRALK